MNDIMTAHKELSDELQDLFEIIIHPDYETASPEYVKEAVIKERNRLEMLLEVLEEDPAYKRVVCL
jgi:hypothetical protein